MRKFFVCPTFLLLGTVLASFATTSTTEYRSALARVTFYCAENCPYGNQSSTGEKLVFGKHVAVDPKIIPYGATVYVPGLGFRKAIDTGSAVKARKAAIELGKTEAERNAIVVDVFVDTDEQLKWLAYNYPHYVQVYWTMQQPGSLPRIPPQFDRSDPGLAFLARLVSPQAFAAEGAVSILERAGIVARAPQQFDTQTFAQPVMRPEAKKDVAFAPRALPVVE
jgi:3D (Asp-Asp-Asp) domain-containing protein